MRNIFLLFIMISCFYSCEESDIQILEKTISELDKIETIRYKSIIEATANGGVIMSIAQTLYFDFTKDSVSELKFHIKDDRGELIFNGEKEISSNIEKRLILTNENPNVNTPLILTLPYLKKILPQLINNENVFVSRKKDTLLEHDNYLVFSFILKERYIDPIELDLNSNVEDSEFLLVIDKSNYLPKKVINQNGKTGTLSRTIDNIDLDYKVKKGFWSGSSLPQDYASFNEMEYRTGLKNILSSSVGKQIENWELPSLENNEMINISNMKGDLVLLEFWFQGCGWCEKAIPSLNAINEKFKKNGFKFYGIEFIEKHPKEKLQKHVSDKNIQYPTLYKGKSIAANYGIWTAPTFMIIDKTGTIIYAKSGFIEKEIVSIIEKNI